MPIANVDRIMKRILPTHAKVRDEAKEMIQECVTKFIGFVTGEANEACQKQQRKTIRAEDILGAMERVGFEHYVEPLKMYLGKYRESEMLPPVSRRVGGTGYSRARVAPATDGHYTVQGSAGGGYCNDRSGPSTGPLNAGQNSTVIHDGDSMTLGPRDTEVISSSRSSKTRIDFQPYIRKR